MNWATLFLSGGFSLSSEGIGESVVVQVWERQAFPKSLLDALGLKVVFRGVPSDAGGPDYQDAILAMADGTIQTGDIEFHVAASDWVHHRHDRDPKYNNVILHVVWRQDHSVTWSAGGRPIPVLEVGTANPLLTGRISQPALSRHPCIGRFSRLNYGELMLAICRAGMGRFNEKADVFEAEIGSSEPNQVLYRALFASLGYASNRSTFETLAETVPHSWLLSVPRESWKGTLMNAAGFGPPPAYEPPARLRYEHWRLSRIRPANHPGRRIAAIAELLARIEGDLAESVSEWVESSSNPTRIRRKLMISCDDGSAIGSGRADEIAVSVILPFVAAMDRSNANASKVYAAYPSPPTNRWTRHMLSLMHDAGHKVEVKRAIQHQGLHALYHGHCRYERRTGCSVCGVAG